MRITIEVDDKLGENIKRFCKLNDMTYTEYLSKIIEEKFNVDRFGDLNEKVKKKQPVSQPVEHIEEEVKPEKEVSPETYTEEKKVPELNKTEEPKKTKRQLKIK